MVIRTELCSYSEYRMYPGRGQRFIAKDGRSSVYITKKAKMLALNKVKIQRIRWSVAWRRANKKYIFCKYKRFINNSMKIHIFHSVL